MLTLTWNMGLSKTEETGSDIALKKKKGNFRSLKTGIFTFASQFPLCRCSKSLIISKRSTHVPSGEKMGRWLQLLEVICRKMGDKILHKQSLDPAVWNRTEAEWLVRGAVLPPPPPVHCGCYYVVKCNT